MITFHGNRSSAKRSSPDLHGRVCRSARQRHIVGRFSGSVYLALISFRRNHPSRKRSLYLPSDPTPASQHGTRLLSAERQSSECPWNAGSIYCASPVAAGHCYSELSSRMVLSGTHDYRGSALPSVYFHVWHEAVRRSQRGTDR